MFEPDKITRNGAPSNGSAQKDTPLREASKPLMLQGKMWVIASKAEGACLLASLDSIKWLLWHGNQHRAGEEIAFFEDDVDGLTMDYPNLGKFARAAHEFAVYIARNPGTLTT